MSGFLLVLPGHEPAEFAQNLDLNTQYTQLEVWITAYSAFVSLQSLTIENRQRTFYVANRVTLTGKNYIKYLASPLNREYIC